MFLCLGAIIAIVALTTDGGRLMEERRRAQASADAAALAAARELYQLYPTAQGSDSKGLAKSAALASAASNGYANDGKKSKVTVEIPPKSGAFAGKKAYAEITIESHLSATFGAAVSGEDLVVKARSVALGRPAPLGLVALRPNGASSFVNDAQLALTLLGAGIYVNSDDPAAFDNQSNGLLSAASIDVTGGWINSGSGAVLTKINSGSAPIADPLRYLPPPDPASLTVRSNNKLTINSLLPRILQPGIYRGGIKIEGISIVIMMPGVYILEGGGLEVTNLATLTSVSTMIYNTQGAFPAGPITLNSLGKVVLAAPLTGYYRGIGIYQDRNVALPISLTGTASITNTGLIYAAASEVRLRGLAGVGLDLLAGGVVANTINIGGMGNISIDLLGNEPQIPEIRLVE
ncbi:MAG: pilus assembly protein TadG-related protein [Gemmataceae bacterium]|nr:pilus assembly protein TadG-related protein [Gemmataceae bacterium]MCI0739985.1 pilus assembly protein TadG-related protein [Gemmataceae bacterium]